jgi:hypothetical protein
VAVNRGGSITIRGMKDFRAELKKVEDSGQFEEELKVAHWRIALIVEAKARPRIAAQKGAMGTAAAGTLSARKSITGAQISLGSADVPWAQGIEFGAKRNLRRIVKNTRRYRGITLQNGSGRNIREGGRATIVRDDEDLDEVLGRVRSQTIDFSRKNTAKKFRGVGAFGVDAATYTKGRRAGQNIVVRGWNQFLPWRGIGPNAGYGVYPAIRESQDTIVEIYVDEVGSITRRAFPD